MSYTYIPNKFIKYDNTKTFEENRALGATLTAEKMNRLEEAVMIASATIEAGTITLVDDKTKAAVEVTFDKEAGTRFINFSIPVAEDGVTPHIGENGNWFIGDTDTGVKANYSEIETKVTELETTLNEAIANSKYPRIEKTMDDIEVALESNKLYIFPEMASLTLTLTPPEDTTVVNEYHFLFVSGATATTLTIPDTINIPDNFSIEANKVYEISVFENNLLYNSWTVVTDEEA